MLGLNAILVKKKPVFFTVYCWWVKSYNVMPNYETWTRTDGYH